MLRHLRARLFRQAIHLLSEAQRPNGKPGKNNSFTKSMKHALRGLLFAFINERNFRRESAAALFAIGLGALLRIDRIEWLIIILNIVLVLALEAHNTAMELTTDLISREYDYNIKGSKDASSGAVLLASFGAFISGLFIFGPRLLSLAVQVVSFLHTK